jgi:hypothetical protein
LTLKILPETMRSIKKDYEGFRIRDEKYLVSGSGSEMNKL